MICCSWVGDWLDIMGWDVPCEGALGVRERVHWCLDDHRLGASCDLSQEGNACMHVVSLDRGTVVQIWLGGAPVDAQSTGN